jgi:NADPH:quinone reductase-like Zn-dependent oxidoreductase
MAGAEVSFDIRRFFNTQKQIRGALMADIEDLKTWMHSVRTGHIQPVVDTVLPLSEAAQAHKLVAANRAKGGVVLLPWCH